MIEAVWLDGLVAALLAITIGYAAVLNRRLANLRDGRGELEAMIGEFKAATGQAQDAVERMTKSAGVRQSDLAEQIETARSLRDELAFLADRGAGEANRLEELIKRGRGTDKSDAAANEDSSQDEAERQLLKSLAGLR